MNVKKLVSLLLVLVMVLALAACGGGSTSTSTPAGDSGSSSGSSDSGNSGSSAPSGTKGANEDAANTAVAEETLVVGLASEPSTLWGAPDGKVENESQIINSALMDRLVNMDRKTGDVIPMLASSWEWIDTTHCKFTLRDDVTMSDGTPLVADDVVYSVGIWREYSGNNDTGMYIDGAEKNDDHTVTLAFNTVAPDLLAMLSWSNFGITSEDEVNAAGGLEKVGRNPVIGSGKYKFVEWVSGQSITLERNDNYWDKDWKGYFKTIKFTFTNDGAAREMAVESGDADIANDLPVAQAATYVSKDNIQTIVYPFGQVMHLWYNMGEKAGATKDIRVRRAIEKALNLDAMAAVGSAGFGEVALGYFPTDSKYYNAVYTPEELAVDLEGAKALLEEAGYGDGLELKILGTQEAVPLYTVIKENLRQIGITVNIDTPDVPQFVMAANAGDYDLIQVGDNCDVRYPSVMMSLRWANINTFTIGGTKYTTEELENSIYAAIEEPDEAKAKEMFRGVEEYIKENCMLTNICPELHAAVIAKDLKGFTTIERGYIDVTNFYR